MAQLIGDALMMGIAGLMAWGVGRFVQSLWRDIQTVLAGKEAQ